MASSSLTHRKLLLLPNPSPISTSNSNSTSTVDPTIQTCLYFCNFQKNTTINSGFCPKVCLAICPSLCHYSFSTLPSPYSPYYFSPSKTKTSHNLSPLLISMLILLATTFLLITFYVLYTKLYFHYYAPYNNNSFTQTRPRTRRRRNNVGSDFLGEEHGNRVDFHPFWYIPTVGLSSNAIQMITVEKYVKDIMMEERDCAVCLAEFEEGEDLKVLPKCNHAFHIPCIDTWLFSHTTCPLCRAPIIPPDPHHDDHGRDRDRDDRVVENITSSVVSLEVATEDNSPVGQGNLSINNITTREEESENNNLEENLREINNNKGSFSQRWSLERGAANLLSRSLSCSGKMFSSSCSIRSCPNS